MGIYDREYYRDEEPGFFRRAGSRSVVVNLVIINVGVYLVQVFTNPPGPDAGWFTGAFSLFPSTLTNPLYYYQFVTYGFLHNPDGITHILFNMIGLWFFGRAVENKYGSRQFLSLYLTMVVAGGLVWILAERMEGGVHYLLGASGGLTGVILLFAISYPKQTVLLWFVLPVPAWVLAVLLVVMDLSGAVSRSGDIAFTCHLGGAAMAGVFYQTGWHLGRLLPGGFSWEKLKPRPRLRIHDPEEQELAVAQQVDEILQKIQQHGQDSLTRKERRILEDASRRYQQKHR